MQFFVILAIAICAADAPEPVTLDAAQKERLLQTLSDLGTASMTQQSEFLCNYVMRDGADISGRVAAFGEFLESSPFTDHHVSNLMAHITYGTADRERMARFSGAFAASAVNAYWENPGASFAVLTPPLLFLERLFVAGDDKVNQAIAEGANDALRDQPVALKHFFSVENLSPELCAAAMQCCLSLGVFKGDRPVGQWLDVPERMAGFADSVGVWLFDGDSLSQDHVHSLESIFDAIPRSRSGICALFVPEAVPFSATTAPLRLPAIALDIPVIPMEILRDMSAIPPHVSQPPLPEFTALALEQAMKAIITTNLPKRPDLVQRAGAVMRVAVAFPDSPLAQLAPPEILMGTPDLFLTYLGVQWLANAEALLEAAIMLAETGTPEPLYAILLVADLFSWQGDTTLLFQATPTGAMMTSETALRRMFLTPVVSYVNGIAVGGQLWQYDMSTVAILP